MIFLFKFGINTYPTKFNKFVTKLIAIYATIFPISFFTFLIFLFENRENLPML